MYRDVILKYVITLLSIHIRPCIKLDSEAVGYAAIAKVFTVFPSFDTNTSIRLPLHETTIDYILVNISPPPSAEAPTGSP
jgi:hypothetical protein